MDGVTQIVGLLKGLDDGARGLDTLRQKLKHETGRFSKEFKKELENDLDVPWPEIRSRCEVQPEFFGLMFDLTLGMRGSEAAMRKFFESFVEPPDGGRYDKAQTIDRVMQAAEKAAVAALPDGQARDLATRRLLVSKVEEVSADLTTTIESVGDRVESVDDRLVGTQAVLAEIAGITRQLQAHIESSAGEASDGRSVDPEQMQALLEAQTSQIDENADRRIDELADRIAARLAKSTDDPDAGGATTTHARAALPPGRGDHLATLRKSDRDASDRLERLLATEGASGVADAIMQGVFDSGPPELLIEAARIVTDEGFFAQAESAYLRAADLSESDGKKARQYVRAAQMASIQGVDDRYQRHLNAARELDAAHPALLIVEARASSDSQFMLDHVAAVEPENPSETALLHQTRAQAHLGLGNEAAAQAEFETALAADAHSEAVREFGAILPLFQAMRQMAAGQLVDDTRPLVKAAEVFEDLAGGSARQGRSNEAAQLLTRGAHCRLLADQHSEAIRVLNEIPDPRRLSRDAAADAAELALLAERPDLARRFVPPGVHDARSQLVVADALTQSDKASDRSRGTAALEQLITSTEAEIATSAAVALLVAATKSRDISWSDDAAQVVAQAKPEAAIALRAEHEALHGNFDEAQKILLPKSDRPAALRRLRDYAAMAGQWGLARDRTQALLRDGNDPRDRLALGEALRKLGDIEEARLAFASVANDRDAPAPLRDSAFGSNVDLLSTNRDYESILRLAREWRTALPDSRNAAWNEVFALARLSRHAEAWKVIKQRALVAETEPQATLLAEVLYRAAEPTEAITELVALSDKFDRKLEAIEALIIATALDVEPDQPVFAEPIESRVRDTFARFPERFPDSDVITAVPAPKTPEEIDAFLRDLAGDTPQRRRDAAREIEGGRTPVNLLAAFSNRGVAQTWLNLSPLPLGFATEHAIDVQAAREAIGGAAVWDPSALAINCLIALDLAEQTRTYLPGSVIVTETLEDADSTARAPGKAWAHAVDLPSGEVGLREISEAEHAADEALTDRLLAAARALEVTPSRGNDPESQLLSLWNEDDGRPEFRLLIGTLLAATRTGRPVYSDDRFVRAGARSLGLKAFSTLALLDALVEQDLIDDESRLSARRALATRGAWGIELSGDELVEIARASDFNVDSTVRSALADRARWRAHPGETSQDALVLLEAVDAEAPSAVGAFFEAILGAAGSAAPEVRSWMWLEMLLLLAWFPSDPPEANDHTFLALIDAAKQLPPHLKPIGYDAVVDPMHSMLRHAPTRDPSLLRHYFWRHLGRLRLLDQTRVLYEMAGVDIRPRPTPGL